MATKNDLENKVKELQKQLHEERSRPTGSTISHCNIDMTKPDETKLAIARAVAEGMKALQSLGGNSYGIYLQGQQSHDR